MRRLGVTDAGWLLAERPDRPMHVGGLLLLDPPDDAPPDWLRSRLIEPARAHRVRPPFDQRLARPYGRAGLFHWVTEEQVDLDVHVRHLALPAPGRIRELLELVSADHSTLLDRHRPPWQITLVEGLEDGRVAAYAKIHHSLLDGVAAMRQLLAAFTPDPDARELPPPWALEPGADAPTDDAEEGPSLLGTARSLVREAGGEALSAAGVARVVAAQALKARRDAAEVLPFRAPRTVLDQPLTGARRYVAQSYELDRLRGVADAFGVTLNDVILALCSTALRTYLQGLDALPPQPLVALVPVALPAEDHDRGNALTLLLADLATHLPDPVARLEAIRASMERGKERLKGLNRRELRDWGLMLAAPTLLGQMTRLGGRLPPVHNLTISNVPGPTEPLYWNGARLSGVYPMSLLPDGDTLNITKLSYAGSLELGITASRDQLPGIQRLIDHVEDALTELEKAAR